MPDLTVGLAFAGSTLVALLTGYFLGYHTGRVMGELRSLKSTMAYYRSRRSSRRDGSPEAEKEHEHAM